MFDFAVFRAVLVSVHKVVFLWKSVRLAALTKDTAPRIRGDENAQCGGRSCSRKRKPADGLYHCPAILSTVFSTIPSNDLASYARQKLWQSFMWQQIMAKMLALKNDHPISYYPESGLDIVVWLWYHVDWMWDRGASTCLCACRRASFQW